MTQLPGPDQHVPPQYGGQPGPVPYPQAPSGAPAGPPQPGYPSQGTPPPYGPTGAGYGPGPVFSVPPRVPAGKKRRGPLLIALVAVLALALLAVIVVRVLFPDGLSSGATAATTAARTTAASRTSTAAASAPKNSTGVPECSSGWVTAPTWTTRTPSGWTCVGWTSSEILVLTHGTSMLDIGIMQGFADATEACSSLAEFHQGTKQADTQWAGAAAVNYAAVTADGARWTWRCAMVDKVVYVLTGIADSGSEDLVASGMDTLTSSWTWL